MHSTDFRAIFVPARPHLLLPDFAMDSTMAGSEPVLVDMFNQKVKRQWIPNERRAAIFWYLLGQQRGESLAHGAMAIGQKIQGGQAICFSDMEARAGQYGGNGHLRRFSTRTPLLER